jgi:3-hydroxy-9,10-secoandrosta-1,3,5(10)-triene-9,17-dione monooxygenase reductase component
MDRQMTGASMGADEFRDLMARWVTGVAVITCVEDGLPVGCTVNALTSISLSPPLLLVSLETASYTLAAIRLRGTFAVNILAESQSQLGHHFSRTSRDKRFAGVKFAWVDGIPALEGSMISVICSVTRYFCVADHVLVVGEALREVTNPVNAPAVFFQRSYWRLSYGPGSQ